MRNQKPVDESRGTHSSSHGTSKCMVRQISAAHRGPRTAHTEQRVNALTDGQRTMGGCLGSPATLWNSKGGPGRGTPGARPDAWRVRRFPHAGARRCGQWPQVRGSRPFARPDLQQPVRRSDSPATASVRRHCSTLAPHLHWSSHMLATRPPAATRRRRMGWIAPPRTRRMSGGRIPGSGCRGWLRANVGRHTSRPHAADGVPVGRHRR